MNKFVKFLSIILISLILACNKTPKGIVLFPDSTNYEYKKINDTLIKVIRFFPNTKDTSFLYFYNQKKSYKDSISYWYNNNNKIIKINKYYPYLNKFESYEFYMNGKLKKKWTVVDSMLNGNFINYYDNGQIYRIREFIQLDGKEYLNNERIFEKNGTLKEDSTYFIELKSNLDTISINDSLLIEIKVKIPTFTLGRAYTGDIDDNFKISNFNTIEFIQGTKYYYRPKMFGNNKLKIIFEINTTPKQEYPILYKTFLEKKIYVTK